MGKEKTTRQRLAVWSKTPEGRESYEKVASEMRMELALDDEVKNYFKEWVDEDTDSVHNGCAINDSNQYVSLCDCARIARHFAQWGAEHRGSSEIPKDLDEAAEKYQDDHTIQRYAGGRLLAPEFDVTIKEVFIAGAKWMAEHTPLPEDTVLFNKGVEEGKRLMMEVAVEGEVVKDISNKLAVTAKINLDGFKFGDKVRVIVLPKEDEK